MARRALGLDIAASAVRISRAFQGSGGWGWGFYKFLRSTMQAVYRGTDDTVTKFAEGLDLMTEEQRVVVIDNHESALLRTDKVFLVGRVLTRKAFNKDRFKRQMLNLWRPKTRVAIVELDNGLFSFGFDSRRERAMVQKGGHGCTMVPCLYWRRRTFW